MRMVGQRLSPGVENGEEPDLGPEVLGVFCDGLMRFQLLRQEGGRCGVEQ